MDEDQVKSKLETFVTYFVENFEGKLEIYQMICDGKIQKPGKSAENAQTVGSLLGRLIGGAIGYSVGQPGPASTIGASVLSQVVSISAKKIGHEQHLKKILRSRDLLNKYLHDKTKFRLQQVKAAIDVFQSFEMQFMRVTTKIGPEDALRVLAQDAVDRVFNCEQPQDKSISERIMTGTSKLESLGWIRLPGKYGFPIKYQHNNCKKAWKTSSLYEKAGILLEEGMPRAIKYFISLKGNAKSKKYGYRRLLPFEQWSQLQDKYEEDKKPTTKGLEDYNYVLTSENQETYTTAILKYINDKDPNLSEERYRQLLDEMRTCILSAIKNLKGEYHQDINLLKHHLKTLKTDTLLQDVISKLKRTVDKVDHLHQDVKTILKILDKPEDVTDRAVNPEIWFNIRKPINSFCGRDNEKFSIHEALQNDQGQIVILTGLSGVGKSELARYYAYDHHEYYDGNVIWINAHTEETTKQFFGELCQKLRIPLAREEMDIATVTSAIYKKLSRFKSLFIFDDAKDYASIKYFLPLTLPPDSNIPKILLTSANQDWIGDSMTTITLGFFNLQESILFLKNTLEISDDSQDNDVISLAETMCNSPLALQQAVAYIRGRKSKTTIRNYLEAFNARPRKVLQNKVFEDVTDKHETIFHAMEVTIENLKADELGDQALKILNIISYYAPSEISNDILEKLVPDNSEDAIGMLTKYSLCQEDEGLLYVHTIIQFLIRLELQEKQQEVETLRKAFDLLKQHIREKMIAQKTTSFTHEPHVITLWNYVIKHQSLVNDFLEENKDDVEVMHEMYFSLLTDSNSTDVISAILDKLKPRDRRKVVNKRNKIGWTALHLASQNGYIPTVNLLLSYGTLVTIETKTKFGFTALHLATKYGRTEIITALIGSGANVNAKTKLKYTPLHFAAENGNVQILNALLNHGAKINEIDVGGFAPLHVAAMKGHSKIVDMLLNATADVSVKTTQGKTPLCLAKENNHSDVINALLRKENIKNDTEQIGNDESSISNS